MPRYLTCDQHSGAWLTARRGRITASRMAHVIDYNEPSSAKAKEAGFKLVREAVAAGVKGIPSAKRTRYFEELRAERLTHRCIEHYVTPYMDHGTSMESIARMAYEVALDVRVEEVGFAIDDDLDYWGASVDGLVGTDGMVEIKGPQDLTHFAYKEAGIVPPEYEPQMMTGMEVNKRKYCDFISYIEDNPEDPIPLDLRLFVVRLDYDPTRAQYLRNEAVRFNDELEQSIAKLRGKPYAWTAGDEVKEQLRKSVSLDDALLTDADIEWAKGGFK